MVFGGQADRPDSERGRCLIAHDFAHVIQQFACRPGGQTPLLDRIGQPSDRLESEAHRAAALALRGERPTIGSGPAVGVPQRAPAPPPAAPARPYYQEALDALAEERRQIITLVRSRIIPDSVPLLEKLVALCEAIDRGTAPEVRSRLEEFLTANAGRLPLVTPSNALVAELSSRMLLLGMEAESERLRR